MTRIERDPDAPRPEPWDHWVIYKMPADISGLPEGVATADKLSEPLICIN